MMTTAIFLAALAAVSSARAQPAPVASTVTLRQVYDWALERSESLKIQEQDVERSRQSARGAKAGLYPRLDWELVESFQDPDGVARLSGQGFSGFVEKESTESRFALRQPLFSGFKEFSAFYGFRREIERDELRLQRARRELFERAAEAYYAVLARESEAANAREGLALALDRIKDLRGFLRLGKARDSELFTAQARAAALKAALKRAEAGVASAREELSFLAGRDLALSAVRDDLADMPALASLDIALSRAGGRSDVRAQREDLAAAEKRVSFEQGAYWPSLDLLGRYYTTRATFMGQIHWDAALSLSVPLFQGGRVSANVERARSARRQSELALEEVERRAAYEARRLHGEYAAALEAASAQDESALAAQKSYDALRSEYALGLVTNLDVLQALDLLLSQRLERDAAHLDAKRLLVRLGVAVEALP